MPNVLRNNGLSFLKAASLLVALTFVSPAIAFGDDSETSSNAKDANEEKLSPEAIKYFEQHVRPLLADKCFKCHSDKKQSGEYRLDSRAAMVAGGESGEAVVPGKPDESLLVEAIRYESYEMPPDGKMKDEQIAILVKWIEMGAPWPGSKDHPVVHKEAKPKITEEDRQYWAFQPIKRPTVPTLENADWCENEIDAFVLRKLRENNLEPAPAADNITLLRRLSANLVGLPPTVDDVKDVAANPAAFDYDAAVDRMLSSERYGEKWARHWLDLVRYAESDGFRQDAYRPLAWKYRDYVIRSFNEDKPYDQFVTEQLAGDEVAPHDPDALVATGFLRHWIYEYNQRDVRTQWQDILNDVTDVTGDVFLSMGMGCARCHDHKFDPILQKDYFRLQAFFTPILPRDDVPVATPQTLAKHKQALTKWQEKTAGIREQIEQMEAQYMKNAEHRARIKFPKDIQEMMLTPEAERAPLEHQLAEMANQQVIIEQKKVPSKFKDEKKKEYDKLKAQLKKFDNIKPAPLPLAMTVTDVGPVAPETIITGDRKREPIAPGFLSVINESPAEIATIPTAPNSTGRRAALAQWMTDEKNPLTARVMVNRIWQYHFGRGLVNTASDFGNLGEKPSHPELLDWLATEFVKNDWSIKHIHRLILNSATYRQQSVIEPSQVAMRVDPQNRLLWRMNVRRLEADQIRDSVLAVSGELDLRVGGPSVDAKSSRRSIYTKLIRNKQDSLFSVFDAPRGLESIAKRNSTTTSTQALFMFNGDWTLAKSKSMANRLKKEHGADQREFVRAAFIAVFGRVPSDDEIERGLAFLNYLATEGKAQPASPVQTASISERHGTALKLVEKSNHRGVAATRNNELPTQDFTVEAIVKLESMYPDASVRTIASHYDDSKRKAGWSLGVTSARSSYKPRNLILQLVGTTEAGKLEYEVVPSNLHLDLNTPYYVAATVDLSDKKQSGITFYVKRLGGDEELQTASATHNAVKTISNESLDFVIGARQKLSRHVWDGLIDEVRLSNAVLAPEELLVNLDPERNALITDQVAGFWQFNDSQQPLLDSTANARTLVDNSSAQNLKNSAYAGFCHVLLNSSEFIYID